MGHVIDLALLRGGVHALFLELVAVVFDKEVVTHAMTTRTVGFISLRTVVLV